MKIFAKYIISAVLLSMSAYAFATKPDSLAAPKRKTVEIVASTASSIALNAALTELIKGSVHEMRPDRTDNNSFPSRHTSWAFTASSIISRELYRYSPWWSVGAQTLASAVGVQRVRSYRHYGSDVVSGALLGIASTELSYWLMARIFHSRKSTVSYYYNDFRPGIAVTSEAIYTFRKKTRTGFGITFHYQQPFSEHWGAVISLRTSSLPMKNDDRTDKPINIYGATVGGMYHIQLPVDCLALETSLQLGAVHMEKSTDNYADRYALETDCNAALNWRLTNKFAVRATLGYRVISRPNYTSAITIGISSIALF